MICAITGKRGYKTKKKARRNAENAHANNPLPGESELHLMVYRCPHCDRFHWGARSRLQETNHHATRGDTMTKEMNDALYAATVAAIKAVGIDVFKSTSMFMSNKRSAK